MPKRCVAVISLLCACFLMVATTVVPHHHHDDGRICIELGLAHGDEETDSDTHAHSCCDKDCLIKLGAVQDASQIGHSAKAGLFPVMMAAVLWDTPLLPLPEEHNVTSTFIYIEHNWGCIVDHVCGMRAPPMA